MPDTAASGTDAGARPDPAVTAQPHRLRLWCAAVGGLVVVALTIVAILLPHSDDGTAFHRGDQYAVFGVGVLIAGACWLPTRPRLRADRSGLYVRGILGPYKTVPWTVVRAVEFRARWHWARAILPADETISLYAVQRVDGARSVAVMRALRELHATALNTADRNDTADRHETAHDPYHGLQRGTGGTARASIAGSAHPPAEPGGRRRDSPGP